MQDETSSTASIVTSSDLKLAANVNVVTKISSSTEKNCVNVDNMSSSGALSAVSTSVVIQQSGNQTGNQQSTQNQSNQQSNQENKLKTVVNSNNNQSSPGSGTVIVDQQQLVSTVVSSSTGSVDHQSVVSAGTGGVVNSAGTTVGGNVMVNSDGSVQVITPGTTPWGTDAVDSSSTAFLSGSGSTTNGSSQGAGQGGFGRQNYQQGPPQTNSLDRNVPGNTNSTNPLENMRSLEHYLNDIMRVLPDQNDVKGFINSNTLQSLGALQGNIIGGKSTFGLDDQAGVLLEEPGHLVDPAAPQSLSSPSRSSPHSPGSEGGERFSRKVFVGGLPPDIDEDEITASFRRFGPLVVDWPHKAESKSYFPPKGYAFLLFQDETSVQQLIDACITDEDKLYLCVSSPTIKDKPVQIRPWRLSDADFVLDASMPLDPRKTVFVGGVPRPLKAVELAMIMDRLYGGVCYAGIDTDPELKYPKGAGRVAFSNQQSYIAAISARFVQLQHGDIDKRVEVKPYVLDDQMCDECQGQRCGGKFAPFFCANVTCLQYYCENCWATIHSRPGREFHKPLVKEGADRPRAVPFRWC
ncbi:cytoplasmic polyadenylation element-binding protein 2 isoform X2 [Chrysoperla carnea]|uniref:cytoplasmic polyadenylation element-binding protein 2 isoform X2 n=1 Tax=Chrysoperla carnea TaxID=189513 RepID=UPI001D07D93C|nr:cytoplasmic polyadenylation element-binding protein 2 isoform X2 [Chrysoperla carnea]